MMKFGCFCAHPRKKSSSPKNQDVNPNPSSAASPENDKHSVSETVPSTSTSTSTSHSSVLCIQDRDDLRQVFKKFDANGDGKISLSELERMIRGLGFSGPKEEIEEMMKMADTDGDGFISLEEFLAMNTQETDSSKCMEDLKNAFTIFDRDHNGLISAEELHLVLKSMGEKATLNDCKSMIKGVDKNGDGAVSFEEFMTMMTKSST